VQYYMEQNGGPQISVSPVTLSGLDQKKLSMTQPKMKRVKKIWSRILMCGPQVWSTYGTSTGQAAVPSR
jgi:hypothetical protein